LLQIYQSKKHGCIFLTCLKMPRIEVRGTQMGNIDAFFAAHEAAYERRYGPIFLGTLIEDMRRDPQGADYTRALRKRQKTGEHETHICEDCGGEFEELVDAKYHKRRCVKCRRGSK
jgi:hypothetical protein